MKGPRQGFRGHLVVAVLGCLAALAIFVGFLALGGGLRLGEPYALEAVVPTAAQLTPASRVTMAGADVGTVTGVRRDGLTTVVDMEVEDERVTPIPADSRVTVRQRTPVGENYLEITPGSSEEDLESGAALPVSQADEYVDVDQILSVLRGRTRDRAREMIQGTGQALAGRGPELNDLVGGGAKTLQTGAKLFELLSADREHVAQLVDRLGRVSAAIGERGETVEVIANDGLRSLRAVAASDQALARLLDELPPTLQRVRSTSGEVASVSDIASPVVNDLTQTMRELRPAITKLRPAAATGRDVLRRLNGAAPPLEDTLDEVQALAPPLVDALPELLKTQCEVNPMLRYLKPYTRDAIMSLVGLGSASNSYDSIGHLIRLTPILGENSSAGSISPEVSRAAHTLLRSGVFSESAGLSWNPYPKPNMIGEDQSGPGKTIHGPKELGESGYVYPRIKSDC